MRFLTTVEAHAATSDLGTCLLLKGRRRKRRGAPALSVFGSSRWVRIRGRCKACPISCHALREIELRSVQLLLHVKYKPDLRAVVGSKHPGDGIAKVKAARKQPFLLSFSYVCPEPVLVNRSSSKARGQMCRRKPSVWSSHSVRRRASVRRGVSGSAVRSHRQRLVRRRDSGSRLRLAAALYSLPATI
eukprot:COSAG06_NODE_11555_length_1493_cov_1.104735_1_plen_188_part_00